MLKEMGTYRALLPVLRARPTAVVAIIVLGVLSSLAEGVSVTLFIPFLQSIGGERFDLHAGELLTDFLGGLFTDVSTERRVLVIAACILGMLTLKAALGYGYTSLLGWYDGRIGHQLRRRVFDQLLRVGYEFLEKNDHGDLLNTLSNDTWRTGDALKSLLGGIITLFTVLLYIALLLLISWQITLVVSVALLAISSLVRFLRTRVEALGDDVQRANRALTTRMVEGLRGMAAIRIFGRERYEKKRFSAASNSVSDKLFHLNLISGTITPVYEVLTATLLVGVLLVGVRDATDVAALFVFIFILYRLQPQVQALDAARLSLESLKSSVQAVTSLLDRDDKPYIISGTTPFTGLKRSIKLEKVSFHYALEWGNVLEEIDLEIPANQMTALVGMSGSGKSTLIKLLIRLYDPTSGRITVDDVPLGALELEEWRRRVAFVSQEPYIFNGSVRDNIAYGRLNATDDDVLDAARKADAHDFILGMQEGYDSILGDEGARLSGGQKQRIALARAIIRDPLVLILDEATNALDTLSEHLIQQTLQQFRKERTVIVIAHRLSTVEEADQIVVMEEGRVRECGTLHELLDRSDLFARLYQLQYRNVLS